MTLRLPATLALAFGLVLTAGSASLAADCSAEIAELDAAIEQAMPMAERPEAEQTEITLAQAGLEVLCDEFDEWESGAEAAKQRKKLIEDLKQFTEDDDDFDF